MKKNVDRVRMQYIFEGVFELIVDNTFATPINCRPFEPLLSTFSNRPSQLPDSKLLTTTLETHIFSPFSRLITEKIVIMFQSSKFEFSNLKLLRISLTEFTDK